VACELIAKLLTFVSDMGLLFVGLIEKRSLTTRNSGVMSVNRKPGGLKCFGLQ